MSNKLLNIEINIYTEIEDEGGSEIIHKTERGTLSRGNDIHMIKYEEDMEGAGLVLTTIIIYDDRITLKRTGAVRMHQVFKIGAPTESVYQHPYGSFRMETTTHRMEYLKGIKNKSGRLLMIYDVILNDQEPRNHTFELQFEEVFNEEQY